VVVPLMGPMGLYHRSDLLNDGGVETSCRYDELAPSCFPMAQEPAASVKGGGRHQVLLTHQLAQARPVGRDCVRKYDAISTYVSKFFLIYHIHNIHR
jgi:hypothetical protein